MNERYMDQIKLRTCQCDMYGSWLPSAILDAMQDAASSHCEVLGLGNEQMDELGLAWVLSRVKVQMNRLPKYGDTVSVETFPTPCRHLFYPRANVFRSADGEELGYANSLWVLLDKSTRKVTQNAAIQSRIPTDGQLNSRIGLPTTVHALEGTIIQRQMKPRFTDFDIIQHVNNTRYMDFCCDALGHEVMTRHQVAAFDVNYENEILPDCEIQTELVLKDEHFSFFGYSNDRRHFAISGSLILRDS